MEVASGEFGEAVHKLVCAVSSGKCSNYNYSTMDEASGLGPAVSATSTMIHKNGVTTNTSSSSSAATTVATTSTTINDISKTLSSPAKMTSSTSGHHHPSTPCGGNDEQEFMKLTKGTADTVINMPNNDELVSMKSKTPGATCTTSLLDSNESVVTLPNKGGFPTSGFAQFWILLKRAFLTIIRDQQLTQMRLLSHIIVGAIIGMIYYDIGNEASKVMSNAGCIFFTTLFTMFTAMMPTILTCKFYKLIKYERKIIIILFSCLPQSPWKWQSSYGSI